MFLFHLCFHFGGMLKVMFVRFAEVLKFLSVRFVCEERWWCLFVELRGSEY